MQVQLRPGNKTKRRTASGRDELRVDVLNLQDDLSIPLAVTTVLPTSEEEMRIKADPPKANSPPGNSSMEESPHAQRWLILVILLAGGFLLPLDFSIVNVALPAIQESLLASPAELQLIIALYAVFYSVLLVTGGRIGDLLGRKETFITGLAAFMAASAACGFAPNIHVLIGGRVVQGFAASLLMPQILATIRVIFPPEERARAIGLYGVMIGSGLVLGQLIGGFLINLEPFGYTWQSIFLVNLPVGAFDLLAAAALLPKIRKLRTVTLDLPGVLSLTSALVLLVYPLTVGREHGWPAWTLLCMASSMPMLGLFVWLERRLTDRGGTPLLELNLFRERAFSVGLILSFLMYANAAYFFSYAVYLQDGLKWSALHTGLATLPFSLDFLIGSLIVPLLIRRLGLGAPRMGYSLLIVGEAVMVAILVLGGRPALPLFAAMALAGLGAGIVFPSIIRLVLQDVAPEHAGMASGALTTAIQVGPAFAVPIIGGVFFTVLGSDTSAVSYTHAFATVLICTCAVYATSLGLTGFLKRAA
jgi:MFS family permease